MYIFAKTGTNECNRESRVLLRNVINKRAKVTFSRQIRTSHFSREWIYIYRLLDTDAELTNERRNEKEKIVERGRKKKGKFAYHRTSLWRHVRVMKRLSKKIRVQSEKHEDARYVET